MIISVGVYTLVGWTVRSAPGSLSCEGTLVTEVVRITGGEFFVVVTVCEGLTLFCSAVVVTGTGSSVLTVVCNVSGFFVVAGEV